MLTTHGRSCGSPVLCIGFQWAEGPTAATGRRPNLTPTMQHSSKSDQNLHRSRYIRPGRESCITVCAQLNVTIDYWTTAQTATRRVARPANYAAELSPLRSEFKQSRPRLRMCMTARHEHMSKHTRLYSHALQHCLSNSIGLSVVLG
jgi:hypothetical protein